MSKNNDQSAAGPAHADVLLLTADEVAAFLKVPVATLYAWRHKGVGPQALRVGKYLRYRLADIISWLASR